MLTKPKYGWTEVVIGGWKIGTASYVDDVPNLVLDTFTSWFAAAERGSYVGFCLEFDAEGHHFGIIEFDDDLYSIDDQYPDSGHALNVKELEGTPGFLRNRLSELGLEAVRDIRENIDDWKYWNPVCEGDEETAEGYKTEYLRKCDILESLIIRNRNVQHETCISEKNTCENTCFTGNKNEDDDNGCRRKVLVTYGLYHDKVLFITDAPKPEIENWCRHTLWEAENGGSTGFGSLEEDYYVRVLFDTEEEIGDEDIDVIGYDEVYDLSNYDAKDMDGEEKATDG